MRLARPLLWPGIAAFLTIFAPQARAQIGPLCQSGCVGINVTPDGGTVTRSPNTGPFTASFFVDNTGTLAGTYTFTCSRTGGISCGTVTPSSATIPGLDGISLQVSYTVGATPGRLTLTATGADIDQGYYDISLLGAPQVALQDPAGDNKDRSACFTSGAGASAGVSCGDLFVIHSMPAFRTLGRDRVLSLHYNSASATGLTLVAATVTQPSGLAAPQSIKAVLKVGTVGDSASYTWTGTATKRQVVLGRGLTSLATGIYPMTFSVTNIYTTGGSFTSTVNGTAIVVSRAASEYGRGWGLLGVEQVLVDSDADRRLWLDGDGSARIYQRGVALTAAMLTQSGLGSFSAAVATDRNTTTQAWNTNTSGTGAWVQADLGTAKAVTFLNMYVTAPSAALWDVQYSDNATAWSQAFTGFKATSGKWNAVTWTSTGKHRYWRLRLTNTPGNGTVTELSFGDVGTFYGAPGDNLDSLVTFTRGGQANWYRRDLEHGAEVQFDPSGHHTYTYNRARARTRFHWRTIGTCGERMDSILVPPGDTVTERRGYVLSWSTTSPCRLISIKDPRNRTLTPTFQSDALTKLTDPDGASTRFAYTGNRMKSRVFSLDFNKGDSVVTTFVYQNAARLTSVSIQADSAATANSVTTLTPWDEKGLAIGLNSTGQTPAVISGTLGVPTRIDPPLPGTGDAVDVWFDRFGAARRTLDVGPNTMTDQTRANPAFPALVTQVQYPTGRTVSVTYDVAGNVIQTRDAIPAYNGAPSLPTRIRAFAYTDARWPESPTAITDTVGGTARVTTYTYTTKGLTDEILDPRGLRTKYAYTGDSLPGLVQSITSFGVETYPESANDLTDVLRDQIQKFTYDSIGNIQTSVTPTGVATTYQVDSKGRVTRVDDALRNRSDRTYDEMNRPLTVKTYSTAQTNPLAGFNPLQGCVADQSTCADNQQAMQAGFASTTLAQVFRTFGSADSVLDPRGVRRVFRYDPRGTTRLEEDDYTRKAKTYVGLSGRVDSVLARTNLTTRYRYDNNGRLDSLIYPLVPHIPGATFSRVVPGDTIVTMYDAVGNVTYRRNGASVIRRLYYGDGSVYRRITESQNQSDTVVYSYDATGATSQLTHGPDVVDYVYDPTKGDLNSMTVTWGAGVNATRTFQFQWDKLGRRRQITYPTSPNTMMVKFRYDAAGVLRRVVATNTASGQNRFNFTFRNNGVDPLGRVLSSEVSCPTSGGSGQACGDQGQTFTATQNVFNRLGWLAKQTKDAFVETMRYDESGNLIFRSGPNGTHHLLVDTALVVGSLSLSHNRLRRDSIPGGPTPMDFFYREDGSRIGEYKSPFDPGDMANRTYYHDGLGRMTGQRFWVAGTTNEVEDSVACVHDADGRLMRACGNGALPLAYDGDNVVRLFGTAAPWSFIHGPGLDDPLTGALRIGGQSYIYYWVTDGQGREFAVGDSMGRQTAPDGFSRWRYAGATKTPDSFDSDRQSDGGVRPISYFRNRAYDQQTGRWTQEDPIGVAGGLNLYQFNGNNPVAYTDPFGLCPEAANGSVCIDLFIQAKRVGPLRGDGRTFDANAAPSQSRAQIVVAPGGKATTTVSPSCVAGVGCNGPRSDNTVTTTQGANGSVTVDFNLKNSAVPFGASPDIDGSVTITPDGKGGVSASGNVSAYPSNAVYQRVDGKWQEIHRHTETTPIDLFDGMGRDNF
jgi:RHS repeat-associated protein